ncbi:MAG TPA: CARDB domain-containing protein, partial [Methanomicrobiales archaeon]|nr:CARDB domain-containing protein [Methanomicrobiales archaeon]
MIDQSRSFPCNGAGTAQRLLLALLLPCLLLALIPAAGAAGGSTVTITDYQVSPSVLLPGEQATITVVLKNTASVASSTETSVSTDASGATTTTSETTDLSAKFDSVRLFGNGLEVVGGAYDHVGSLGPGQSMPLTFLVRAPTQSGMYFPEVWVHIPDGSNMRYPVPVNVNSNLGLESQAILIVNTSLPASVQPGDEIPVTLTVKNAGELQANDVTVRIETSGTTIAPKSTDLYHLGTIQGGQQQQVDLVLISDRRTASGLTCIPVTLQYTALDGKTSTQNASINIPFKGQAELGFVSVDTNPRRIVEGQSFDLTIRIENTGTGEAKQV